MNWISRKRVKLKYLKLLLYKDGHNSRTCIIYVIHLFKNKVETIVMNLNNKGSTSHILCKPKIVLY